MARKAARDGESATPASLRVQLSPATDSVANDPLRQSEIADLVAQIVLLGRSRRRKSYREKEITDAA